MASIWTWLVSWLVWMSADPVALDLEHARAAAAVSVARASMKVDRDPAPPAPAPKACDCGGTCVRGMWKPDGRVSQRCQCVCTRCVAERAKGAPADCPTGTCPNPSPIRK
jgi:hypothetical protein